MAEFEDLRIRVRVDDEASGQLGALKQNLDKLGGLDVTRKFEGIQKQLAGVEQELKKLMLNFATSGPSMAGLANFAKGIGPIGLAAVAVYETLRVTIGALKRQAQGLLDMEAMAKRVGESTAQYMRTMEVWERSGVSIERAGGQWETFVDTMNHLRRMDEQGRATWQSLLSGLRGDQARRAEERLREIIAMPTNEQAANALKKFFDDVGKYYARQTEPLERAKGPEEQRKLLRSFGLTDLDRVREAFTIVGAQEAADMDKMVETAREFNRVSESIKQNWDRIMRELGTRLMEGPLKDLLELIDKSLTTGFPGMPTAFPNQLRGGWWEFLFGPLGAKAGVPLEDVLRRLQQHQQAQSGWDYLKGGGAQPLMSTEFAEGQHKQLTLEDELIQQLKRFHDLLSGDEKTTQAMGAGAAASLGINDIASTGKTASPQGRVNNDLSEGAYSAATGGTEGYNQFVNRAHQQGISPSILFANEAPGPAAQARKGILFHGAPVGRQIVKASAFGQYAPYEGSQTGGFVDPGDVHTKGQFKGLSLGNYGGYRQDVPGVALPYAGTAGRPGLQEGAPIRYWDLDTGRQVLARTVDTGPDQSRSPSKEKGIDVNAPLQEKLGYAANEAQAKATGRKVFPSGHKEAYEVLTPTNFLRAQQDVQTSEAHAAGRRIPLRSARVVHAESTGALDEALSGDGGAVGLMTTGKRRARSSFVEPEGPSDTPADEALFTKGVPAERVELDRALGKEAGVEAKGNVNVKVKAPAGTRVKAHGDGMFKGNVSLDRRVTHQPHHRRGRRAA